MRSLAMTVVGLVAVLAFLGCEANKKVESSGPKKVVKTTPAKKAEPASTVKKAEPAAAKFVLRVSAGAEKDYTDQEGKKWLADKTWTEGADFGAEDGATVTRSLETIAGTKAPQVYLTERYSMGSYRFTVPNGKYTVRLHFAETYDGITAAGERVFSVSINGKQAWKDLDVFKEAKGFAKPLIKETRDVQVTDGKLVISFAQQTQNPEINGIEILGQ